jgi:hypothetical protein
VKQLDLLATRKPSTKPRRLTVGYSHTDTPFVGVPYLRLRGHWLEDAGFTIGDKVKVEVKESRLMIERLE